MKAQMEKVFFGSATGRSQARIALALAFALIFAPYPAFTSQQPAPGQDKLRIVVVEGQGAVHGLGQRASKTPVVRIEDEKGRPVQGASVLFTLPDSGPSGTLLGRMRMLTVTTGRDGRAEAQGLRANNIEGQYQIQVRATYQGLTATAAITQINSKEIRRSWFRSGKAMVILAAAGGGVAVALVAGRNKDKNASSITITAGTPKVGGPQ